MAESQQDQVYSCRKMDAKFPGSVADGYLKSLIKKRHYKTFEGMIRCAKEEWLNIPLEMFQKALSSWSDRLLKIHKARGYYVPQ